MTTTNNTPGTPRTSEDRNSEVRTTNTPNRGIYWAVGIAIVLLAIVFAMRPLRDTAATSTTGTVMSESATTQSTSTMQTAPADGTDHAAGGTPTDATSGSTYDNGAVNNTTTTPPAQRK